MIRLKAERKRRGLSQAKLARIAGINQTSLSKLEHGSETLWPGWANRLARALEWRGDPSELMEEIETGE